jgi:endo-1,4-beta-xylanase
MRSIAFFVAASVVLARGAEGLGDLARKRNLRMGAAVNAQLWSGDARYRQTVQREYNMVVAENAMKFGRLEPARGAFRWDEADSLAAFCARSGIALRGHNLVWHQQSEWVEKAAPGLSRAELLSILKNHIDQVVGRYRGKVVEWDVVNEAVADDGSGLRDSFWRKGIGDDYLDSAFAFAHRADANALLYYNDYGGEGAGAKSDRIYALVKGMKERGIPIHGVGLQCHFQSARGWSAAQIGANLKRLAALGLKVSVTELDLRLTLPADSAALEQQGAAYALMLRTCLAEPTCVSFLTWGFTDAHSWVPGFFPGQGAALPFDAQYAPKPAYRALADVLREGAAVEPARHPGNIPVTERKPGPAATPFWIGPSGEPRDAAGRASAIRF